MTTPKNKRTRFSSAKKVEILDKVQKGDSRAELCRSYEIASSTLHTFIKDKKKFAQNLNQTEIQNVES